MNNSEMIKKIELLEKQNEKLRSEVLLKKNELKQLNKISKSFKLSLKIDKVLDSVVENTAKHLKCEIVSILLLDKNKLKVKASIGIENNIKEFEVDIKNSISGYVISNNKPLLITDINKDNKFNIKKVNNPRYQNTSLISVPLQGKNSVIGVMNVNNKKDGSIFTEEELEFCEIIAAQATIALENAELYKQNLSNEIFDKEMEFATSIQNSFLPDHVPLTKNIEVFARHIPARKLSGDYYHFFEIDNNNFLFSVGDVSGKGISAALFMARLISYLEIQAKVYKNVDTIINNMNRYLVERSLRGMFLTTFIMSINPDTGEMFYTDGGHPPAYLISKDNEVSKLCHSIEPPIGINDNIQYRSNKLQLKDGDTLVLYTDGLFEAKNSNGELFSIERLENIFEDKFEGPVQLGNKIYEKLFEFSGSKVLTDDTTCLIIQWHNF